MPKLVELPGQVIPFLLMQHFGYDEKLRSYSCETCPTADTCSSLPGAPECVSGSVCHDCQSFVAQGPGQCSAGWGCQPSGVFTTIVLCFGLIPATFMFLALPIMLYFPLRTSRQHDAVLEQIKKHEQGTIFSRYSRLFVVCRLFFPVFDIFTEIFCCRTKT